ncbi:MAG: hypothetical protein J6C39_05050 [Clostridia bacterium]|nr:hypothetical protein [Clostridia bacterium]MBO5206675.1 hypothetical protein [Clostridia bacterium]MBP3582446.1 hypothetical protein [Clostridia bacterium]
MMGYFTFDPMQFVTNLKWMGIGMLGVFMIVGIIMGSTYLIGYLTSRISVKKDNSEE